MKRKTRHASGYAGEVLVGPRGGSYYVDKDGVRVYLVARKKPNRNYNPPAIYRT